MQLDSILKAIKTYGATAVLVMWILRQEVRLNSVEDKLYNCYTTMKILTAHKEPIKKQEFYAILPTNPIGKVRKNERT